MRLSIKNKMNNNNKNKIHLFFLSFLHWEKGKEKRKTIIKGKKLEILKTSGAIKQVYIELNLVYAFPISNRLLHIQGTMAILILRAFSMLILIESTKNINM